MKTNKKLTLGLALFAVAAMLNLTGMLNSNLQADKIKATIGELVTDQIAYQEGVNPTIGWLITRPEPKNNNGHGNNVDGVDSSNEGAGGGGPNGAEDTDSLIDDEVSGVITDPSITTVDNVIRQVDTDTGVTMDITTQVDAGEAASILPIEGSGSTFELWGGIGEELVLLDNTVIGPYMAAADFVVTTKEGWAKIDTATVAGRTITNSVYRTRSDYSYGVDVTVNGLSIDPFYPIAAREVQVQRAGANGTYDPINVTYPLGPTYTIGSGSTRVGGAQTVTYSWEGYPALTNDANQDNKLGVERFEVIQFADVVSPQTSVGKAHIVVWPVGRGYFTQLGANGLEPFANGQEFTGKIRDIYVNYRHLYPGSKTYVQIYKGEPGEDLVGRAILNVTRVPNSDYVENIDGQAQNTTSGGIKIRNADLQRHINYMGNGTYTLQVLHGGMDWLDDGDGDPATTGADYYEIVGECSFVVTQSVGATLQIGTQK